MGLFSKRTKLPAATPETTAATPQTKTETEKFAEALLSLRKVSQKPQDSGDEWLRAIYSAHVDLFKHDNDRIWSLAAIFIPIWLAAFPALFALNDPTWPVAVVFAMASTGLIYLWNRLADRHKQFQEGSQRVFRAFHIYALRSLAPDNESDNDLGASAATGLQKLKYAGPSKVRDLRWRLVWISVLVWTMIILGIGQGWFD